MPKILTPWSLLKEPKFISSMWALGYSLIAFAGYITLTASPGDLAYENGIPLALVVGSTFMLGGFSGVLSLHGGEWWIERFSIWIISGGIVGYVITLWGFEGSFSEKVVRTCFSLVVIALLAARFYKIRGFTLDPTK